MAAYKAIKINKNNKKELEAKYGMSDDYLEYSSGLYLVAEFAATQYHAVLTKTGLEANFTRGKDLDNGFFEIAMKPKEPIAAVMTR